LVLIVDGRYLGKLNHEPTLIYHEGAYLWDNGSESCVNKSWIYAKLKFLAFDQLRFMGVIELSVNY
jgi:hypothetical protein